MQRALAGPRLGSKRVQCITKFRYPNFLFTSPETHSLFVNAFLVWERKGVAANLICAILRCPTSLVASFPLQYLVRSVDTCTLAYSLSSARWHLLRGSSLLNNFWRCCHLFISFSYDSPPFSLPFYACTTCIAIMVSTTFSACVRTWCV